MLTKSREKIAQIGFRVQGLGDAVDDNGVEITTVCFNQLGIFLGGVLTDLPEGSRGHLQIE